MKIIKLSLLILIECLLVCSLQAQTLKGRILNEKGLPIPHATIFIHETMHGIVADDQGVFQTNIDTGEYTLELSSLGYERTTRKVVVTSENISLDFQLTEKPLLIQEIIVTPSKEDPAYRVMRNVIARAPYHLHQVKSYNSDIYFKGTFLIEKIPALIRSQIKEPELKTAIGKRFIYESHNEITYEAPDKIEQRVTALSSTIPEFMEIGDGLPLFTVFLNIYNPTASGGLLGPNSFSVYKFKLEEIYEEGNNQIYKIRIIPRKNNSQLVNGHLYIVDNNWSIHKANLSVSAAGITMHTNLTYQEIKQGAFLPVACEGIMDLSLLGIKGNGNFHASFKYNNLETNEVQIPVITDTKPDTTHALTELTKKQQQNLQKIEEIANKEKLTNRDAATLAKLINKEVEPNETKDNKRNLEIKSMDSKTVVTRDSMALLQDSSFWNKIRSVPLRHDELQSYLQRDSLRSAIDSLKTTDSLKNKTVGKWVSRIISGDNFKLNDKLHLSYDGLLNVCPEYNFVDGFRLGQRIQSGIRFNKNHSLSISSAVYYTTARKEVDFVIDGQLIYAPLRNGHFSASAGNTIADYAGQFGPDRLLNALGSILFAENTAKFYQKKFATVSNEIDLANGLKLTTSFSYENRNDLDNNTSWNLFNKVPKDNRPRGWTTMPNHESYNASFGLEYTPRYYYHIFEGKKKYLHSAYPTLRLRYDKGFAGKSAINSSFDKIEASFHQSIRLNLFNKLYYESSVGAFLSAKQTYLPDYKHFNSIELLLTGKSFNNSFTLDNYTYVTNERWAQLFVTYSSQYLLLKQLPFTQRYLFDEAIHLKTLWIPGVNHNEAGYSIGLGDAGRIGVFFGFQDLKYDNFGFVISLPLFNSK